MTVHDQTNCWHLMKIEYSISDAIPDWMHFNWVNLASPHASFSDSIFIIKSSMQKQIGYEY